MAFEEKEKTIKLLRNTMPFLPLEVIHIIVDYAHVYQTCDKCDMKIKHLYDDGKSCAWEISLNDDKNLCKNCWKTNSYI